MADQNDLESVFRLSPKGLRHFNRTGERRPRTTTMPLIFRRAGFAVTHCSKLVESICRRICSEFAGARVDPEQFVEANGEGAAAVMQVALTPRRGPVSFPCSQDVAAISPWRRAPPR